MIDNLLKYIYFLDELNFKGHAESLKEFLVGSQDARLAFIDTESENAENVFIKKRVNI